MLNSIFVKTKSNGELMRHIIPFLFFCLPSLVALAQKNIVVLDTTNSGVPSNSVTSIKFDKNGDLWVGTSDAGLGFYDGSTWTYYNKLTTPQLISNHISDIQEHPNGEMWFATFGGIVRFKNNNWTLYDTNLIAPCPYTEPAIRFDSKNNVYTKNMYLHRFDGTTWVLVDSMGPSQRAGQDSCLMRMTIYGHLRAISLMVQHGKT
jgi:ligand-binding sensor domain-containing protein